MPRARPPSRLIQTTLTYEGKAASFIWAEGVSRRSSKELLKRPGLLRDPEVVTRGPRSTPQHHVRAWAVRCIDDPFNTKNAPIASPELPWIRPLLDSKQVVITRSPPTLTSLKLLARGASAVVIGAWIGLDAAHAVGAPLLTFVFVPAGVMVVGMAAGVSKGLETGLAQWLVERMTSASRTRQKLKPKRKPKKPTTALEQASQYAEALAKGKGVVIVSAPQGAGKTRKVMEDIVAAGNFEVPRRKR
jgi:hypothetical protein